MSVNVRRINHAAESPGRYRALLRLALVGSLACLVVVPAGSALGTSAGQLWVARYTGPSGGGGLGVAGAVDPSTGVTYATGTSYGTSSNDDFATAAYGPSGAQLWVATYNSAGDGQDVATAVTVDPLSHDSFVTGYTLSSTGSIDFTTVGYDPAGAQLWATSYDGPGHGSDYAVAAAVDPTTHDVYVTGNSPGVSSGDDYATVAYSPGGTQLWAARFNGAANGADEPAAITVDPTTSRIYVTGQSPSPTGDADYATVAYNSDGSQRWATTYNGPGSGNDAAVSIAINTTTHRAFVAGHSADTARGGTDFATVAYDATGAQKWAARYHGPYAGANNATALAVDPSNRNVYVTGVSAQSATKFRYATVAYSGTGARLWATHYSGPHGGTNIATAVAVDPGNHAVYVTGQSAGKKTGLDYATVAYDPVGTQLWALRYNALAHGSGNDEPMGIGVDPTSHDVVVTGRSVDATGNWNYATVAYSCGC